MLNYPALTKLLSEKRLFITGTNTDCGKTTVACQLLQHFNQLGKKTVGIKPVASGAELTDEGLRNEDALALQYYSSLKLPYSSVNPFVFEPPIAPHIAAQQAKKSLSVEILLKACEQALKTEADLIIIEGAGGWLVPLNEEETLADFAKSVEASMILVVGMTLGCLNHALLTEQSMRQMKVKIGGWIANEIDPSMQCRDENLSTLQNRLQLPYLGNIPYQAAGTPPLRGGRSSAVAETLHG